MKEEDSKNVPIFYPGITLEYDTWALGAWGRILY